MRLEWFEDILAVIETGSFIEAAKRRFLSQPAFSRRIRMIEAHVGAELFDRSKKPVQLKSGVSTHQASIRELVARLHELKADLKRQDQDGENQIIIASQHAITTSVAPSLIKNISAKNNLSTLLKSANRDECYALLMTKQVDLILIHHSNADESLDHQGFFQKYELAQERLIPVCLTSEHNAIKSHMIEGRLPVIAYPSDSYLGQVIEREVFFQLRAQLTIDRVAETSLTLAILPMTLAGVGVGWLPDSLVAADLASGQLTHLRDALPDCELSVMAIRLHDSRSIFKSEVWETVAAYIDHR